MSAKSDQDARVNLRLPSSLVKEIKRAACREGLTMNAFIRRLIERAR